MYCREPPERGWQLLSVPSLEMRQRGYETFTGITDRSSAVWGSASCSWAQQSQSCGGIGGELAADGVALIPYREGWGKWNDVHMCLQVVGFLCFVLFCFNVTCCNAYHRLNVISDLNNNSVDNLLEFLLLEARWEGWKVAEAAVMHLISSLGAPSCVQQDFCLLKLLLLLLL